ncbi:MAG: peroxiredoxin [Parcubacteria group bacterium]|nr:peroxiredoxin [Parcubacteria group bacterium]
MENCCDTNECSGGGCGSWCAPEATRLVGRKAPSWTMESYHAGDFHKHSLSDFKGKWLVMFFYPLDFTFVCPTEIRGFSDHLADFQKLGADVVGISVDSKDSHKAWVERDWPKGLNIPLLSDITKEVSQAYGVYLEDEGTSLRGTFIIDPEGKIRYMVVSDNNVGRSVKETLRTLEALQSGKLCPVEWEHGQKTLN